MQVVIATTLAMMTTAVRRWLERKKSRLGMVCFLHEAYAILWLYVKTVYVSMLLLTFMSVTEP